MSGANSFIQAGLLQLTSGDFLISEHYFSHALEVLPSFGLAYFYRAEARSRQNKAIEAVEDIQKALSLEPENEQVKLGALRILKNCNRQDLASKYAYDFLSSKASLTKALQAEILSLPQITLEMINDPKKFKQEFLDTSRAHKNEPLSDRTGLINYCIERFNYKKYLEIGCHDDQNFSQINCEYKVGVDPIQGGTQRLTSNVYFSLTEDNFDIIFIDGLHRCEQVYRDIENSLLHLNQNGVIVLHDCLPSSEIHQQRDPVDYIWNGDVWKAFVHFRKNQELDAAVANFDHGVGLIRRRENTAPIKFEKSYTDLNWTDFLENKETWFRPMTSEELKDWI